MSEDLIPDLDRALQETPTGAAFFARQQLNDGPFQIAWFVREQVEWIEQLGPDPEVEFRASMRIERLREYPVAVIPVLLRVGATGSVNIYETWINPLASAALELLICQRQIDVHLYGDHCHLVRSLSVPNTLQGFAEKALSTLSRLPYWGMRQFDTARSRICERYSSIEALWAMLEAAEIETM